MDKIPTVSVLIPAHNSELYISYAIESILRQTFTDWEIIVVDDGSAIDNSAALSVKFPEVKVFRQNNQGLSGARNACLKKSRGRYVAFLDADDFWEPTKLERQVAAFESDPELGLCYTSFDVVDKNGGGSSPGFAGGAQSYLTLLKGCCICVSTVMIRRSLVEGMSEPFDRSYAYSQDYNLWLAIAQKANVKYISTCEVHYRRHDRQMSASYINCYSEISRILQHHLRLAQVKNDAEAQQSCRFGLADARRNYACQAYDACRSSWRQGEMLGFVRHLWRSVVIYGSIALLMHNLNRSLRRRLFQVPN